MIAVSRTLNTACGLKETRPWWWRRLVAIALTLTFAVLIVCALLLIFYGGAIGETLAPAPGGRLRSSRRSGTSSCAGR